MAKPGLDPKVRDLAEKIYIPLVSGAVEASQTSVKMSTDPLNLAQISFKLATAFIEVENRLNEANMPKNQDFKVGVDDIAAWSK